MTQGPSSSADPYLVPLSDDVSLTSILTTGDAVGVKFEPMLERGEPWRFVGTPDGLGAYDNGNGTMTVLANHELQAGEGTVRAHGATGAFISELIVDKETLGVLGARDLIQSLYIWDRENGTHVLDQNALDRLCSADLPEPTAFFNPATNKGYAEGRIFLNGEESGADGRAFAHFVSGPQAGQSYELPWLGQFSHENQVANPHARDETIVIGLDDARPGQVYVYVGQKQADGTALERAGLTDGQLFGIAVEGSADEDRATGFGDEEVPFSLVALGDASEVEGAALQAQSEALGVTEFLRPEDGAWDPLVPDRFYFVTTDRFDETKPGATDPDTIPPPEEPSLPPGVPTAQEQLDPEIGRSRLWQLDFENLSDPAAGGTLTMLLDGTEAHQMLDNMTVNADGQILLQEDPGNVPYLAKIWQYEPNTDELTALAEHDPALFGVPTGGDEAVLTANEESSGIIDVTSILGGQDEHVYLFDVQAHYDLPDRELDEGGQILAMTVQDPVPQVAVAAGSAHMLIG
jgi:hypothetical protein